MADTTEEEINLAVKILAKLEPGKLPLPIFLEITRLTVTPILEVVPLRINNGRVEVLLLEREKSDPVWGGMLHTPGTVIRASDVEGDFTDAFNRIFSGELNGLAHKAPNFVVRIFHQVKRGRELAEVYYAEVDDEPLNSKFYDSSNLPAELVDTQRNFIAQAVNRFRVDKQFL